ncbi:MAG: hypothetical protein IJR70_08160 [Eubacterium sp.]|nr:hypothetical protein [Eubacterium sp.]
MNKKTIIITSCAFLTATAIGIGIKEFIKFYKPEEYKVASVSNIMNNETRLIAHRGFRALAPENTLPAYEEAGKAGFWGAECDIYRTADGVWVTHHDPITARMMTGTRNIEKSNYSDLLAYDYNNGNNVDKYPNLKICKFEEYLAVCEKYGMRAVIELKGKNNLEYFDELINLIDSVDVEPVFISFNADSLRKIKELKPEAKLFLVVDDIRDEHIQTALDIGNCGIDFDVDIEKNYKNDCEMIKKGVNAGLEMAVWACDYPEKMQRVVDLGVKYITTDCLTEY